MQHSPSTTKTTSRKPSRVPQAAVDLEYAAFILLDKARDIRRKTNGKYPVRDQFTHLFIHMNQELHNHTV